MTDAAIRLGVELKRTRTQRCPLPSHEDREPSFSYDEKKNLFHCFGCGAGGSVIDFVSAVNGCTPKEAVEWLTGECSGRVGQATARPERAPPSNAQFAVDPEVYEHLCSLAPLAGQAIAYLLARAITGATAEKFNIGFVSDAESILRKLLEKFGAGRLYKSGLIGVRSRLVFPDSSLIFPYMEEGRARYVQARHIGGQVSRWTGLRGVPKRIYNLDALLNGGDIYICEGVTDVLSAHELGLNAIGLPGALTRIPAAVAGALRGRAVYVIPDQDDAGVKMGDRVIGELRRNGIQAVLQSIPAADLNEYLRQQRGLL